MHKIVGYSVAGSSNGCQVRLQYWYPIKNGQQTRLLPILPIAAANQHNSYLDAPVSCRLWLLFAYNGYAVVSSETTKRRSYCYTALNVADGKYVVSPATALAGSFPDYVASLVSKKCFGGVDGSNRLMSPLANSSLQQKVGPIKSS